MPFVLVVLFTIALIVTVTGFLLTPRQETRSRQNKYVVTPRGRRIVDAAPIPTRSGRNRVSARASSAMFSAPSLEAGRYGTGILNPDFWERMVDRWGAWRIIILLMIIVSFFAMLSLNIVFPHSAIWSPSLFGLNSTTTQPTTTTQNAPIKYTASTKLVRLSQLDPAQYQSTQEYNTWAYSACSAAAMTEVINSYGHNYRVTDILKIESGIHEITPQEGLLEEIGIQRTATLFHFNTRWGHNLNLNQIIAVANSGTPVIVSFPPQLYDGGHLLVVRGGNSTYIDLADSSLYNRTQLTHAAFMKWWGGFSAILTPA